LPRAIGIDLAGSAKRSTRVCLIENLYVKTFVIHGDDEIFNLVSRLGGELVAIDTPLSIPKEEKSRRQV